MARTIESLELRKRDTRELPGRMGRHIIFIVIGHGHGESRGGKWEVGRGGSSPNSNSRSSSLSSIAIFFFSENGNGNKERQEKRSLNHLDNVCNNKPLIPFSPSLRVFVF